MQRLLILLGIIGALALPPAVHADGRYGRGYDRHSGVGYQRPFNRHYYPYRPGAYVSFSVGRHYHHDHLSGSSFLGGLVLGSVLTHSASRPYRYGRRYYGTPVNRGSTVTVIRRTPVVSSAAASGRRLLRDLSGRCYEIIEAADGNEIRTELDPSACNF